jgi:hypothetical protein
MSTVSEQSKLKVRCPDCGSELVVDRATGEVLFHRAAKQPLAGGKDFDSLLAGLGESKARAEEVFEREVGALKDRDRLLEEKFREALEQAENTADDELPLRPWELD